MTELVYAAFDAVGPSVIYTAMAVTGLLMVALLRESFYEIKGEK